MNTSRLRTDKRRGVGSSVTATPECMDTAACDDVYGIGAACPLPGAERDGCRRERAQRWSALWTSSRRTGWQAHRTTSCGTAGAPLPAGADREMLSGLWHEGRFGRANEAEAWLGTRVGRRLVRRVSVVWGEIRRSLERAANTRAKTHNLPKAEACHATLLPRLSQASGGAKGAVRIRVLD